MYGYADENRDEPLLGVHIGGVNLTPEQAIAVARHITATALEVQQIAASIHARIGRVSGGEL